MVMTSLFNFINANFKTNKFNFKDALLPYLPFVKGFFIKLIIVFIIFFVGTKLIKLGYKALDSLLFKAKADSGIKKFTLAFANALSYALLLFIMASQLGFSSASIAAVIGSAGLALGLALQGSLSNLSGGILILITKPFRVGDYIISSLGEGSVSMVGLIYTTIISIDNRKITIPNGTLANATITNNTALSLRRINLFVDISYESELTHAKNTLHEIISKQELLDKKSGIDIVVDSFSESSIVLNARFWCKTDDYRNLKSDVLEHIKYGFDKENIEIPYHKIQVINA